MRYSPARRDQLLGGLVGQYAAEGPAAEPERPLGLCLPQVLDVPCAPLLHAGRVLEPLQAEERLAGSEQGGQLLVDTGGATRRMGGEEGESGAARLQRSDCLPRGLLLGASDDLGDVFGGRGDEQLGAIELAAQLGGEMPYHLVGLVVLTTKFEELSDDADPFQPEDLFEDPHGEPFGGVAGHHVALFGTDDDLFRGAQAEFARHPGIEALDAGALQQDRRWHRQAQVVLDGTLDPYRDQGVQAEFGERNGRVEVLGGEAEDGRDPAADPLGDQLPGLVRGERPDRLGARPVAVLLGLLVFRLGDQCGEVRHPGDLGEQLQRGHRIEAQHPGGLPVEGEERLKGLRALRRADRVEHVDTQIRGPAHLRPGTPVDRRGGQPVRPPVVDERVEGGVGGGVRALTG